MKLSFRMLAAIVVVYVLAAILRTPYAHASTPVPTHEATDRDVLVAFYYATDGDNWLRSDNWLTDAPIGTWYGVTTDDSGRVIELVLWFNELSGTIPPELGDLTALTRLDFSGNRLSGTIPTELGNLTALTYLRLSGNNLSGTVPPELGNLVNLDALYLAGNRLTGCQLAVWKHVEYNDLDQLDLPYCAAATDRDVLVALFWAANGDKWTNNDNWLSDAPLGTWYGVTADKSGRVIELDLWHNNLSGTIPPELGNLTALTNLRLSGNNLNGTVPPELSNLTALTNLYLGWNRLSGTIPPELGNLTALTYLGLSDNQLSGTVPPELSNLTALTNLRLRSNELSGTIPPELGNLTALTALYLGWNQLSGTIPPELSNLTALTALSLSDNQLSGTVPPELGNLANLDTLYLAGNRLTGCQLAVWKYVEYNDLDQLDLPYCAAAMPAHSAAADRDVLVVLYLATDGDKWTNNDNWLSDAPIGTWYGVTTDENGRVIELELWYNNLRGALPPELGNLSNLRALTLSGNELSGSIPPALGNLTNLEWLSFGGNQLEGVIPSELSRLNNLSILEIEDNQLSGTIPPELGNLTRLTWLALWGNQLEGTIPTELGNLANLDALYLAGNRLTGCQLAVWKYVENNDLDQLSLPYCADGISVHSSGGDRDVLVTLYWAANGDKWTNNDNWLSDAPLGTWYGITTDESGRVIELGLAYNNLSGTIPPELGNLTALTNLTSAGISWAGRFHWNWATSPH